MSGLRDVLRTIVRRRRYVSPVTEEPVEELPDPDQLEQEDPPVDHAEDANPDLVPPDWEPDE